MAARKKLAAAKAAAKKAETDGRDAVDGADTADVVEHDIQTVEGSSSMRCTKCGLPEWKAATTACVPKEASDGEADEPAAA